jgi:zinc protease
MKHLVLAFLIMIVAVENASAQSKDHKAEEILKKYVEAAGGKDALGQVQNIVSTSELLFLESNISLNRKIVETRLNEYHIKVTSSRMGEITRGYDGTKYWEKRQDKIILIGDSEKTSILNSTAFLRYAEWQKNLVSYSYEGIMQKGEAELYKLAVVTIYGAKENWYFSTSNYLLTQIEEPLELPEENSIVVTSFEDYREVSGIKFSFSQTIYMPGQTRKIIFSEILLNQEVDRNIFSLSGNK